MSQWYRWKRCCHMIVPVSVPVGAALTTSSFSTWHLASLDLAKTTARRDEKQFMVMTKIVTRLPPPWSATQRYINIFRKQFFERFIEYKTLISLTTCLEILAVAVQSGLAWIFLYPEGAFRWQLDPQIGCPLVNQSAPSITEIVITCAFVYRPTLCKYERHAA